MEAVIFMGIQAAGKSTYYKERFFKTHIRINLDMLRNRRKEAMLLKACLEMKHPFVVDNTNPTEADRQRYIVPAKSAGFRSIGYYFQSRLSGSLPRNQQRSGKECIPEIGIRATLRKLKRPSFQEGFDELYYVFIQENGEFATQKWRKPFGEPN
jgi:predicted kinase